jgi:hypothetical protein
VGCWRSAAEQYDIYPSAETDTQKETGGNYDEVRPLRRHTGMIDGIYNLEIKFGEEHVQGVAKVKGNSIKGLDSDRVYVVEFSGQHGKSCWRFSASRYTEPTTGLTTAGSHQITCCQNSEKRFAFEGEMTGFTNVKVSIHGEWIADLPKLAPCAV